MPYRKVHDTFWEDAEIEEFTPEQKYFYLYLFTNPKVNNLGIYEFSVNKACFETGYNKETVERLLRFFEEKGKVVCSKKTKEIAVKTIFLHNSSPSPKFRSHITKLISQVKDKSLLNHVKGLGLEYRETSMQDVAPDEEVEAKDKQNQGVTEDAKPDPNLHKLKMAKEKARYKKKKGDIPKDTKKDFKQVANKYFDTS